MRTLLQLGERRSEGFLFVRAGAPIAAVHALPDSVVKGGKALTLLWKDSQVDACSIELHARVDVDGVIADFPDAALEIVVRPAKKEKKGPPAAPVRKARVTSPKKVVRVPAKAPTLKDIQSRIEDLRKAGLDVAPIEAALKEGPGPAAKVLRDYDGAEEKAQVLTEILGGLNVTGFEARADEIRALLANPSRHVEAEAAIEEFRGALERRKRAEVFEAQGSDREAEMQERARQVFEMILKHRTAEGKAIGDITETEVAKALQEKPETRDASTGLIQQYTFDTFVVGPSNRFAHAATLAVSKQPHNAYNPLFITSVSGLGKTHLLNAIGNHILANTPNPRIAYLSVEAFTNEFNEARQSNKLHEFRDKFRSVDVFLLDDVQFLSGRGDVQEELFHTFNELHNANKQIALSSDRPPKEIPDLEDRLVSRFESGLIADIQPPEFETRIAILRRRVRDSQLSVDENVLTYIANLVEDNIRELNGALNRVLAFSSLMDRPITLETTKEVLRDLAREEAPRRGKARLEDVEREVQLGRSYVIEEERPENCFRLVGMVARGKDAGLVITRSNPKRVREKFGIDYRRMLWLTDRESAAEQTIPPTLERIIYVIEEFMKEGGRGGILVDGIEYLVSNNSFDAVLRFLRRLVDHVSESHHVFFLALSPETMKAQEVKILEREMEVISFA